eukprot:1138763-Pelagomonas_calceolata.AAC.6
MSTLHATAPQRLGKSMKGAVTGSYNAHCVEDMGHANVNKDLDRQQSFLDKMRTELSMKPGGVRQRKLAE